MKKNKQPLDPTAVLQKIKEAIIKEELAMPLYVSHIEQTLFWSGLPNEKQKKIIRYLKILESESKYHIKMLKKLEKNYLKSFKKYV